MHERFQVADKTLPSTSCNSSFEKKKKKNKSDSKKKGNNLPCTTQSQAPLPAVHNPQCPCRWCLCSCLVLLSQRTSFWSCSRGPCHSLPLWETWTPSCSMWSSCENTKINELVTEINELVSCWSPASGPSLASHKFRVKVSARLIHLIPCESLNAAEGDTARNLPVETN